MTNINNDLNLSNASLDELNEEVARRYFYDLMDDAKLTAEERRAIMVVYLAGLTDEVAGRMLGISKHEVRFLLQSAYIKIGDIAKTS